MRKTLAVLATSALSTFSAPAQLWGEIIAETDLLVDGTVYARAGTVIAPVGTTANGNWGTASGIPGCVHGAGYKSYYRLGEAGVPIGFGSYAYTSAHPCGNVFHTSGPHAAKMRFWSAETVQGTLVISTNAPKPGFSSYSVDIGNDGSTELTSGGGSTPGALTIPVTVQAFVPFDIRVDTAASNGGTSGSDIDVFVQFVPGLLFPTYGSGCQIWNGSISSLSAYYETEAVGGTLHLNAWNGVSTGLDPFMIFGVTPQNLPIPPTGCLLLMDIIAAIPYPSVVGRGSMDIPVPPGLSGGQFLVQSIHGTTANTWWTSNGVAITLP